ncbi:TetR family transcriptional regulator [Actinoplanes lobatus]|uniref:AcrR family transcriptional regulator n=1 Tax=Actinoplanes lobatus TaxID=113568 RepID=A0A7W7HK59_9ACTN|nr:TetR/AcrR family transcriptional regulator [Actinoplanes lobatus]MBB4752024.1 AcrR family transcriptional regulator [Actinoplanes lobatus]GGN85040.1 TetR family transcriptional regulator [Actinoplanes lobatus]GIE45353.1 TetR family transcriptional regulator [Actinoplanes lobatus]
MAMGRPRAFDTGAAVDGAMRVFWAKGYDGATMTDLCAATGLQPGSVYAAFGSKQGLFGQAVRHYIDDVVTYSAAAMREPTAGAIVRAWLNGAVESTTGETTPAGCLLVQGALTGGEAATLLAAQRRTGEGLLAQRFAELRDQGGLPPTADPAAIASYVFALAQGIAVQAASGATRDELHAMVTLFTARLPWETAKED